ncbi:hypothetical protein K0M31_003476 [Melipona bicolor]|uniref:Uncharacterized protein n=1 Tax=Melipona bicolor TaxID=60889 RepID=A0AA40FZ39_9HYME|nr:hypothetical protein K0M31_003476 [Melipona bicolor]
MRDLLRQGNSRKSSPAEGIFKFNPDATVVKHHGRCRWEWGKQQPGRAKGGKRGLVRRPESSSSSQKDRAIKTYSIVVVVTTDSNGCPDDWRNKHFTRISATVYLSIELAV